MSIHVLPPEVIGKIAAGEVVQRPASVVKELMENALDASAGRIRVEVEGAGRGLIRVQDDGCGIPHEDLALAVEHHATSKLTDADDLSRIQTLGFRGEALASIGAVSRLTIVSRPENQPTAASIEVEFGKKTTVKECAGRKGTVVEVRDLFGRLPARAKFLKSPRTENAHIIEVFVKCALAHPEVHFELFSNGRRIHFVEPSQDIAYRITTLTGMDMNETVHIEGSDNAVEVEGWLLNPHHTQHTGRFLHAFVNGRPVKSPVIFRALKDAFSSYAPADYRPTGVLFVRMPPTMVDVNVHPAKEEVRFTAAELVYNAVLRAAEEALDTPHPYRPRIPDETPATRTHPLREPLPHRTDSYLSEGQRRATTNHRNDKEIPTGNTSLLFTTDELPHRRDMPRRAGRFLQLQDTYIITATEEGLLIVDQHALHERVLLERIKKRMKEGTLRRQILLEPVVVNLTPPDAALVEENREHFVSAGFDLESSGTGKVTIKGIPSEIAEADPADLFLEALDALKHEEDENETKGPAERLIASIACRGAVKAGEPLGEEEMAELLEEGMRIGITKGCAHGRPTAVLIPLARIEKMFLRT